MTSVKTIPCSLRTHTTPGLGRRRALVIAFASAAGAVGPIARGQGRPTGGTDANTDVRPYLQVKPVPGEEDVVRVFFSPHCAYSRQYMGFFGNLQRTLPTRKRFEYSTLINRGDGLPYALAFETVRQHYPGYLTNFVKVSMDAVQDRQVPIRTWRGIDAIGKAAQVPESLARLVATNARQAAVAAQLSIRRQGALSVTNTPSVAIAGTYIVTPEFTNGDAAVFSQLVNGLISMTI